jgi:predicted permease
MHKHSTLLGGLRAARRPPASLPSRIARRIVATRLRSAHARAHASGKPMTRYWHDVRIALRGLRRTPAFAATAILILGLGIGMATAMYAVIDAVLLQRLPVAEQDRVLVPRLVDEAGVDLALWPEQLEQVRLASRTLRDVSGVAHWGASAFPFLDGDRSVVLRRADVTGRFFDVLGTRPLLGRFLRPSDDVKGAESVIVLSFAAWRRDFGGDPTVVGRTLRDQFSRRGYRVVGVAPPGLDFPSNVDYWECITPFGRALLTVVARLEPGATPAAARAEVLAHARQARASDPYPARLVGAEVRTLPDVIAGDARPTLLALGAAVALLLLIACVNVGTLLLLRAGTRASELAVRRALGATRGDVVRQLLTESALLAVGGGLLALVVAETLRRAIAALAPAGLPRVDVVGVAGAPLGAAAGATLNAVLLFGLAPALLAAGDLGSPLRADARAGGERSARRRVRQGLVAAQVALALVMLAGAALLVRSLRRLERIDLGYAPEHLAVLTLASPTFLAPGKGEALFEQVMPRLRAIPGVTALSPILLWPFGGTDTFLMKVAAEGRTDVPADAVPSVPWEDAGPEYFRTMGIPLVRGRGFVEADRADAPQVAVVSQSLARRLWPGEDPVGKRLRVPGVTPVQWITVVGLAGDTHYRKLREASEMIYLPWRQSYWQGVFAARTTGDLAAVLPAMRRELRAAAPDLRIWQASSMDDLLGAPLARPRLGALVLSGFGAMALALSALGLYGVMTSAVRERTREIGVRMALGATPARVRREVLAGALAMWSVGAAAGLAGALATSRLLTSLLYEISPLDPLALALALAVLLAVALAAAWLPARHATTVDPARALRAE